MGLKKGWQKELSLHLSNRLANLARMLTNSFRDGEILKNRSASLEKCFVKELYIEANPLVAENCKFANLDYLFSEMFSYACYMDGIRAFRAAMKGLELHHDYARLLEKTTFSENRNAETARDFLAKIDNYLAGLPARKHDLLNDEIQMNVSRVKPCVCLCLTTELLDESRARIVTHLAPFVDGEQIAAKTAFSSAKSAFSIKKIKDAVNILFDRFFAKQEGKDLYQPLAISF